MIKFLKRLLFTFSILTFVGLIFLLITYIAYINPMALLIFPACAIIYEAWKASNY